uniref:Uncharacterized protein n=1 Tax=Rhizophora mucronata TaxID=61149 RepID=A0A2P2PTP7_RHIMU
MFGNAFKRYLSPLPVMLSRITAVWLMMTHFWTHNRWLI